MAERAGHDVPLLHLSHSAAGQLELAVGGLVVLHPPGDHPPPLARDVGAQPHLPLELAGPGDGGDLVQKHGLHEVPPAPAIRAYSSLGRETIRENPRASAAVPSPAASP